MPSQQSVCSQDGAAPNEVTSCTSSCPNLEKPLVTGHVACRPQRSPPPGGAADSLGLLLGAAL